MTFKFNFLDSPADLSAAKAMNNKEEDEISYTEAKRYPLALTGEISIQMERVDIECVNSNIPIRLWKRTLGDITCDIAQADDMASAHSLSSSLVLGNTDLIPGVYEGGLKTWECTFDLICYLQSYISTISPHMLEKCSVLELGCGSGLPGIFLLMNSKATRVDFQDYNAEVLQSATIPNILGNIKMGHSQCDDSAVELESVSIADIREFDAVGEFYSGDWATLHALPYTAVYDLIISSETIYHENSYSKLCRIFERMMRRSTGRALISCKSYYYGCGGGSLSFQNFVQEFAGGNLFDCERVARFGDDSLRRDILLVSWKQ
eukprot:Partr_v1_DN27354_c0_g1_i1_m46557 putative Methyltransferase like 18